MADMQDPATPKAGSNQADALHPEDVPEAVVANRVDDIVRKYGQQSNHDLDELFVELFLSGIKYWQEETS